MSVVSGDAGGGHEAFITKTTLQCVKFFTTIGDIKGGAVQRSHRDRQ